MGQAVVVAWTVTLAAALASEQGAQEIGRPPALEVARALQKRYAKIHDFSADFEHTYEGGVLRRRVRERGSVLIKKPGKMKWTYREPERKIFVSDGQKIYSYVPADKQVMVSKVPPEDEATTPALFLTGKGDLLRDFTVSYADKVPGEAVESSPAYALQLVPKSRESEYESLVLVVDRKRLGLRRLAALDHQGGQSAFVFVNLKENVGLSDEEFVFQIPRGVEVIGDARTGG